MKKEILKRKEKTKTPKLILILGLIANIILPGVGTIIIGKYDTGIIQLVLSLVGLFFMITSLGIMMGIPFLLAIWIWALVVSIKALKNPDKK